MNIVIDSNVFFSALIRDSYTRKLILKYDGFLLFPSFIFEEMKKHKKELMKKTKLPEKDFNELLELILRRVLIVPNEALYKYRKEAMKIVKDIDSDDEIFIACALAYPDCVLWSDDKKLKKQPKVKVVNTGEIKDYIDNSSAFF